MMMVMMMMSGYLFPDAVVVFVFVAAADVIMVILLPLVVMTTVMEELHGNNFEAATMLLIRECQLGSASCRVSLSEELSADLARAFCFLLSFPLSLFSSYQKGASSHSFVIDSHCTK